MTAAVAAAPPRSRQRLAWVLLALSLALNVCFLAGFVWTHTRTSPWRMSPEERIERMSAEMQLDPEHRQIFERYFHTVGARLLLMRTQVGPLIGDAWAEIAKPQPDEGKVAKLFDEAAEIRRGYQRQLTTETLHFLATLTPEQRSRFVELVRRPPPSWGMPINRGLSP